MLILAIAPRDATLTSIDFTRDTGLVISHSSLGAPFRVGPPVSVASVEASEV
jgi:hypothetical protein